MCQREFELSFPSRLGRISPLPAHNAGFFRPGTWHSDRERVKVAIASCRAIRVCYDARMIQAGANTGASGSGGNVAWRTLMIVLILGVLVLPGWVFFLQRDGLAFLEGADFARSNRLLFPLVGLYAFSLVWLQVMIGSNRRWLARLWPGIIRYHRVEGVFAFLFAQAHPILLISGIGFSDYIRDAFVSPERVLFAWLGRIALLLLTVTVATALLSRLQWLKRRWRVIHYLNYVVFVLVWIHSWVLGSDVQTTGLRWVWLFYGLTFVASVIGRIFAMKPRPATVPGQSVNNTQP